MQESQQVNEQVVPANQPLPQIQLPEEVNNQRQEQEQEQPIENQQDIPQQLIGKLLSCGKIMKRIEVCQIIIASLNLLTVLVLTIVFQSVTKLQTPLLHVSTAIFETIVLTIHFVSFWILRDYQKSLENNQTFNQFKTEIKYFIRIMIIVSTSGIFLVVKMAIYAAAVSKVSTQSNDFHYDSIIISVDIVFTLVGMQILSICALMCVLFGVIFYLILCIVHLLVLIFSKRRVSVLKRFSNNFFKSMTSFHTQRIKKLRKMKRTINFQKTDDKNHFQSQNCSICLENFADKQMIYELPCMENNPKHCFHSECLQRWMTKSGNCPFCRTSFTSLSKK